MSEAAIAVLKAQNENLKQECRGLEVAMQQLARENTTLRSALQQIQELINTWQRHGKYVGSYYINKVLATVLAAGGHGGEDA